jgi:uncharacterized protein YabN with tetrapyrrole methylase and pyrophosphatase domain
VAQPSRFLTPVADAEGADIHLLGSGCFSFFDLTLHTQDLLVQSRRVFYLHELPSLERYLARIVKKPVNLLPLYYIDGRPRRDIYRQIAEHVLREGAAGPPVALLLHGHPMIFSTITQLILAGGQERGLRVNVVPAVSSLDRMYADLRLDIGNRGIQIFNAEAAVHGGMALNPGVDAILLQVDRVTDPDAHRLKDTPPEMVAPLRDYLLRYYPSEHPATLIECAVEIGFSSRLTPATIGKLEEAAAGMNSNTSMYIPAVGR